MKNNTICILVDSVIADYFGTKRCKISPTPFIDTLKKEGVVANNMYAHGPYTDAATKSLYTGRNCLDDYAFYFRLESAPSNHYKVFHDAGYETYGLYYPYYIIGPKVKADIDHTYYSAGFIFKSEWFEIYQNYSQLIKHRDLTPVEFLLLKKRTKLMLDSWKLYYEEVIHNPQSIQMIKSIYKDFDFTQGLNIIKEELTEFNKDNKSYIYRLLSEGLNHRLALLDNFDVDSEIDRDKLHAIYKEYNSFFSKAEKLNRKANLWKHMPSLKRCLYGISKSIKSKSLEEVKFLANYWCLINDIKLFKKHSDLKPWQDLPSARTQIDFASKILEERSNNEKPFYMSLHFLDTHNYVSFFSYDNLSKINEELSLLVSYLDKIGSNFDGALSYILAVRYVDFCIELFCDKLKKLGIWDNTTIMILADHGSSYSFSPLHGPRTNTFDDENYHVPFIIRSPGFKGVVYSDYYNSKDMFPTLFDIVGIDKPNSFIGHSMLDRTNIPQDFVMTEYTGSGCPDVLQRKLWFSIRDKKYIVGYKVGLTDSFENGELTVYDLSNDPYGFYNVSHKIDRSKIEYLMVHIKKRYEQVKNDTEKFINNLV